MWPNVSKPGKGGDTKRTACMKSDEVKGSGEANMQVTANIEEIQTDYKSLAKLLSLFWIGVYASFLNKEFL